MAGPEPSNAGGAEGERGDATAHPVLVWCEVCGKEEWTAPAMAFASGWDFAGPGGLYPLGVVSPRTCGGCAIGKTVWWRLAIERVPPADLTPSEQAVMRRILNERSSRNRSNR